MHAPAACSVATTATSRTRSRFAAAVSADNLATAWSRALAAAARRASEPLSAAAAFVECANTSDVATFSYCCAIDPAAGLRAARFLRRRGVGVRAADVEPAAHVLIDGELP